MLQGDPTFVIVALEIEGPATIVRGLRRFQLAICTPVQLLTG